MRRITFFIVFLYLSIQFGYGQNPNCVYGKTKGTVTIDLPSKRTIYGGTVFNVTYNGSAVSPSMKGAFEYACKLVEEVMPTTYSINVTVEFSNNLTSVFGSNCLSTVEAFSGNMYNDRVYIKRYAQNYDGNGLPFNSNEDALKSFRDTTDVIIKFASKQPFFYEYRNEIPSNKYDFVTVAIQALLKATGFCCKAIIQNSNSLKISDQANKYSNMILCADSQKNYQLATSGNAKIRKIGSANEYKLVSDAPYQIGVSLSYFKDSLDSETAIMQYGISKGSRIHYIGTSIPTFFSYCEWDRPIATGFSNLSINTASTENVIPFNGIRRDLFTSSNFSLHSKANSEVSFEDYMYAGNETSIIGHSVLLKDGTWKSFENFSDLSDNESYARSVDGYLRTKNVTVSKGLDGRYSNRIVSFQLYSYLPQVPYAEMNSYTTSSYSSSRATSIRSELLRSLTNDVFADVEIGFKNIEGTNKILVEQTDSDYPVPYSYYIDDIGAGTFVAYMNKAYPSTFKLTYINDNGQTVGDVITVDLRPKMDIVQKNDIETKFINNNLIYDIKNTENVNLKYTISEVLSGENVKVGNIDTSNGVISSDFIKTGLYTFDIFDKEKKVAELKFQKK